MNDILRRVAKGTQNPLSFTKVCAKFSKMLPTKNGILILHHLSVQIVRFYDFTPSNFFLNKWINKFVKKGRLNACLPKIFPK